MPRRMKQFLYRSFWMCGPLVFLLLSGAAIRLLPGWTPRFDVILALAGGVASAYYFLQKQHLEELQLFDRLFADFNRRYARLHDRLEHLVKERAALTGADRALLEDYFNLCAEEYFYYTCGIVDSRVWCAWCRGMLQYLDEARIAEFWRQEESSRSYYGMTREQIESGARANRSRARVASLPQREGLATKKAA